VTKNGNTFPLWLMEWMKSREITLWGAADLSDFTTPADEAGRTFPFAISWAVPVNPQIMVTVRNGPNEVYAEEYDRLNRLIEQQAEALTSELRARGHRAQALAVSSRTDKVHIKGDFPHKTAATRAGLGWIGRHCQLITRPFGSWVRLGTVFTDLELPSGPSVDRNFCGRCRRCVEACPAKALTGNGWRPGIAREEILDVFLCDAWKREHFFRFHAGQNCGICSAVCPYGLKALKRSTPKDPDKSA
jgi:epoxyqueuosine reductase